jgi:hypothetical protein
MGLGSGVQLSESEQQVDQLLTRLRREVPDWWLSQNFRSIRQSLEALHPLWGIIRAMPKGALLHTHEIWHARHMVNTGTYRNDCWVDLGLSSATRGYFRFSL